MPATAASRLKPDLTLGIDDLSHDLHVSRVNAGGDTAQVVDDEAGRDLFGMDEFPGDSMCLHDSKSGLESTVAMT